MQAGACLQSAVSPTGFCVLVANVPDKIWGGRRRQKMDGTIPLLCTCWSPILTFVVDEVVTIYLAVFSNQPLHCTNTGGYNITSSTAFSIGLVKFQCANTEILWCEWWQPKIKDANNSLLSLIPRPFGSGLGMRLVGKQPGNKVTIRTKHSRHLLAERSMPPSPPPPTCHTHRHCHQPPVGPAPGTF